MDTNKEIVRISIADLTKQIQDTVDVYYKGLSFEELAEIEDRLIEITKGLAGKTNK